MSISADGMSVPRLSHDATIVRAQDAFAAAKVAKARQAQSVYAPSAPSAPKPAIDTKSGAVIAQISQRAGTTAAMLRQNEPNNPLIKLADGIHQTMAGAVSDPFTAFGQVNDLENSLQFALSSNEQLLNNPALRPLE